MQELRKVKRVASYRCFICTRWWCRMLAFILELTHLLWWAVNSLPAVLTLCLPTSSFGLCCAVQHVKVGIVGGSDLVKIQEQLGDNGEAGQTPQQQWLGGCSRRTYICMQQLTERILWHL